MQDELFREEQELIAEAQQFLRDNPEKDIPRERYEELVTKYRRLLMETRHINRVSDLMSGGLNSVKHSLEERVNLDELTGLYNRRHFLISLERYYKEAMRGGMPLGLLFIDVDCFKKYNDNYGHVMGDTVLEKVAEALVRSTLRPFDFTARYGGEEFCIILPCADKQGVMTVAERVLYNVRKLNITHRFSEAADCVTVSIGVTSSIITPDASYTIEDFIKTADEAMYISKTSGRDRATFLDIYRH